MSDSRILDLLYELDAIHGVSGYEEAVGDALARHLSPVCDETSGDALGNRYFTLNGAPGSPRIMLCAHMDEIGFIVSHIDEDGFVFILPAGLQDRRMVSGQAYLIHTEDGPVSGVTGSKPIHLLCDDEQSRSVPLQDLFLDIGCSSRTEAELLGVQVGDPISFDRPARLLNGQLFSGKAVDDRSGCAVLVEVMRRLAALPHRPTVVAVGSVQEELGIRGAGPACATCLPDIALAIDVTFGGGTPGLPEHRVPLQLGAGPAIKFFDWSPCNSYIGNVVPRRLTRKLEAAARAAGVPWQREVVLDAGTDAWAISLAGKGVLTGCISLPSRYIHSAVGCVHLRDLDNAVELILAFLAAEAQLGQG